MKVDIIDIDEIIKELPMKDCGMCGCKTCGEFADVLRDDPDEIDKCIHMATETVKPEPTIIEPVLSCPVVGGGPKACATGPTVKDEAWATGFKEELTWLDNLGRPFDFILDKFPGETGPRETVILFNPANVEKLKLKKGDVCFGRPAWISCGCPVTHVGQIVEEPDYFNGVFTWCIVGPMMARKNGINIGYYNTTAYEGLVKVTKEKLEIGRRYFFQPRYCMLQWRHCGLVNQLAKRDDGVHVRIEGLWIA